jgi:endo-1,4-beta-xylanase
LHTIPAWADGLRAGGTGYAWVANSFEFAREACPNAVLILNEYNNCEYSNENQRIIDLVATIKAQDASIDAVGCRAHDAKYISVFWSDPDRALASRGGPAATRPWHRRN